MTELKKFAYLFLDQLQRRRWTALLVAWVVCCTGWFVIALMPDRYVSEARFHVDTTSLLTPLLKGISVNSDDQNRDREVAIMQRTLTSRPNLLKVAQMTDLDKSRHSEGALQDLLSSLEDRISIKSQGTNLFLVEYTDNSPVMARNVVQALLTIFVESSIGDKRADIDSARAFIDTQIEQYETQLKAAEKRVADFKTENVQYLSSSTQSFAMRMENAQDALKNAQFEYDDAAGQRLTLAQQLQATPQYLSIDYAPLSMVGGTGTGGSLSQRIAALQLKLDELKLQYTDKHPDVISTRQALERLVTEQKEARAAQQRTGQSEIDASRPQVPNELHSQLSLRLAEADGRLATAKRKLAEAKSAFEALQARASEAPRIEAEFTNLNRDYEVLRSSYDNLLQRRESARIAAAADSTAEPIQFRMVAAPEIPAHPSGPKRELLNTAVLILGLLAGGGFIVLLARIEDRVTSPDDLAAFGEARLLGVISMPFIKTLSLAERWRTGQYRLGRFEYAAGGLAVAFALILVGHPNFSGIVRYVM